MSPQFVVNPKSPLDLFVPEPNSGCWLWLGPFNYQGYGTYQRDEKRIMAHRAVWIESGRDVPEGLQIDHLCRVRSCVNPAHLEWVTTAENTRRGYSFCAVFSRRTACKHGHPYVPGSYRIFRGNIRVCIACDHARAKRVRERAKTKAAVPLAEAVGRGEVP